MPGRRWRLRMRRVRAAPAQLSCAQLVELLTDYLEGVLPTDRQAAVSRHLASCPACTRYLRQLVGTSAALAAGIDQPRLAEDVCAALREAFRELRRG